MSQPKVSIIIPVYNGADFLEECVDSVLLQTFKNWELLIIDDGSTDSTAEISKRYMDRDERIRVIRTENKGVSAARNTGLQNAIGKYIAFVDADDKLPCDSIQNRVDSIKETDMVIGRYTIVGGSENSTSSCYTPTVWNRQEALRNVIVSGVLGYQGYSWNKLFRRKIIEETNLRFSEDIVYNEDRLFCVKYLCCCESVTICDKSIYEYRVNQSGAMGNIKKITDDNMKKYLSDLDAYDRMMEAVKEKYPESYYLAAAEAQLRARRLEREAAQGAKHFKKVLRKKMWHYAFMAFVAPSDIIGRKKKLRILGIAVLGC